MFIETEFLYHDVFKKLHLNQVTEHSHNKGKVCWPKFVAGC